MVSNLLIIKRLQGVDQEAPSPLHCVKDDTVQPLEYLIPEKKSTDFAGFAEFAEENFNRRVFNNIYCTKMVQSPTSLRKFRPERARQSRGESNGRKFFITPCGSMPYSTNFFWFQPKNSPCRSEAETPSEVEGSDPVLAGESNGRILRKFVASSSPSIGCMGSFPGKAAVAAPGAARASACYHRGLVSQPAQQWPASSPSNPVATKPPPP